MKKLITVQWSYVVEAEIPEGIGVDELEDWAQPKVIQDLASDIVKEASNNLNWKDGVITDIQNI